MSPDRHQPQDSLNILLGEQLLDPGIDFKYVMSGECKDTVPDVAETPRYIIPTETIATLKTMFSANSPAQNLLLIDDAVTSFVLADIFGFEEVDEDVFDIPAFMKTVHYGRGLISMLCKLDLPQQVSEMDIFEYQPDDKVKGIITELFLVFEGLDIRRAAATEIGNPGAWGTVYEPGFRQFLDRSRARFRDIDLFVSFNKMFFQYLEELEEVYT